MSFKHFEGGGIKTRVYVTIFKSCFAQDTAIAPLVPHSGQGIVLLVRPKRDEDFERKSRCAEAC